MKRIPVVLLAAATIASCAVPSFTPKRYAVAFGIAAYGGVGNLTYTVPDAISMDAMFDAQGFDDHTLYLNSAATKAELVAQVTRLAPLVGPDDLFVFYFSGHGTHEGTHEYIVPYDPDETYDDTADFVRDDELAGILAPIRTPRKVVILDSCYSGGFISNGLEADRIPASCYSVPPLGTEILAEAVQRYAALVSGGWPGEPGVPSSQGLVLAAAGSADESFEWQAPYDHGIFTYYLLQAATNGDLNHDGYVTAVEMFALAAAGVNYWNSHLPEEGGGPFLSHISGGPVDLVLFGPQ